MMYQWTPEAIAFRADAAQYNNFDAAIAQKLLPRLSPGERICDAGCGLGYGSLFLAEAGFAVTAIDRDGAAVEHLHREADRRGLGLDIRREDAYAHRPERPYDAMLFSIFGDTEKLLTAAKEQCRGRLFLVRKDWERHRFAENAPTLSRRNAASTRRELQALGLPFAEERFSLDMGQPFRALADAERFFKLFGGEAIPADAICDRLCPTGRADFPWYLPAPGELVLFTVETKDMN